MAFLSVAGTLGLCVGLALLIMGVDGFITYDDAGWIWGLYDIAVNDGDISSPSPILRHMVVTRTSPSPTPQVDTPQVRTSEGAVPPSANAAADGSNGPERAPQRLPPLLIRPSTLIRPSNRTTRFDEPVAGPSRSSPRRTMRVYVAPNPKDLVPIYGHIKLFILTGGGGGGVYADE